MQGKTALTTAEKRDLVKVLETAVLLPVAGNRRLLASRFAPTDA